MQYFSTLTVGGQEVQGVLDSGSFELVLFSEQCATCGAAGFYSANLSESFAQGPRRKEHAYGSGTCTTVDGRDDVAVGPLEARGQAFWLAVDCHMPLLRE